MADGVEIMVTVSARARYSGRVAIVLTWFLDRFSKEVEFDVAQEVWGSCARS